MASTSTFRSTTKQNMKVYSARAYKPARTRLTNSVMINIPEYAPTIPKDESVERVGLSGSFFINNNYPITGGTVTMSHYIELPLLRGTTCPIYFPKNTPFLLFLPTTKLEEGYLMYI